MEKMKKLLIVGLIAVVLGFGLSGVAMASTVTSPAADVTATVILQITITKDHDLVFGNIVQGATRIIAPAGAGAGGSAQFTITAATGASISVSVPATTTINGTGTPTPTMTVTLTPGTGQTGTVVVPAGGTHVVHVGGSVTAGATQATGAYTGTFTITAAYL